MAPKLTDEFQDRGPRGDERQLVLDLDVYEGPIEVLLDLARAQKVDLAQISILALVDQYLDYVRRMRGQRLELSADYLVMAAWLAYLKSRLLLPEPPQDAEPSGAELAENLAFQLRRLEAMQAAGRRLMTHPRLGIDIFQRGEREPAFGAEKIVWQATLYDLLAAYASFNRKTEPVSLRIAATSLLSVEDALKRFDALLGRSTDWQTLSSFLPPDLRDGIVARSALAATFAASLELAKSGRAEIRQWEPFGPIHIRGQSNPA
jgi:segregation and condensation protein A